MIEAIHEAMTITGSVRWAISLIEIDGITGIRAAIYDESGRFSKEPRAAGWVALTDPDAWCEAATAELAAMALLGTVQDNTTDREPGEFFTWAELEHSDKARQLGIDNSIPEDLKPAGVALVANLLDPLRRMLGIPIPVTSGYRTAELNAALPGSANSQHMKLEAIDGKTDRASSRRVVELLAGSSIPFDQAIWYAEERGGHFHLSYREGSNRGEVLHAPRGGGFIPWVVA